MQAVAITTEIVSSYPAQARHAIFNCFMLSFDLINEFIRGAMCFLVCICYFGLVVRHIDSSICKINYARFSNMFPCRMTIKM
jgi:hypothetical protein